MKSPNQFYKCIQCMLSVFYRVVFGNSGLLGSTLTWEAVIFPTQNSQSVAASEDIKK